MIAKVLVIAAAIGVIAFLLWALLYYAFRPDYRPPGG